jgi:ribonuclease D
VLREVWEWRDDLPRRADRATLRVLNNEPMLAIAKAPPADLAALKAIPGIGNDQAERRGREILAAVRRGVELPEDQLPRIARQPRRPPDLAFEARLERLKVRRNALAEELELAPGVLCPNGTLEAIARADPDTVGQLEAVPELRRWQARTIGPALFDALREQQPAAG